MMMDGRMMVAPSHESANGQAIDDFPNFVAACTSESGTSWQIVSGNTFDISFCSDRSFSKVVASTSAINCLRSIASDLTY